MKVAIHQPNFLPWAGFFAKALKADTLVSYSSAQYVQREYQNRVRMFDQQEWLTVPVVGGRIPIRQIELFEPHKYMRKIVRTLDRYRGFPHYRRLESLQEIFMAGHGYLDELNECLIIELLKQLDWHGRFVTDSAPEGKPTEKLVKILDHENATRYLCGEGSLDYMELDLLPPTRVVKAKEGAYPGSIVHLLATVEDVKGYLEEYFEWQNVCL